MKDLFGNEETEKRNRMGAPKTNARDKSRWNRLWDTVLNEFGIATMSKTKKTRLGKIVRDLYDRHALPEEVGLRRKRYKEVMPAGCVCTPEALEKHWDMCAQLTSVEKLQAGVDRSIVAQRRKQDKDEANAASPDERKRIWDDYHKRRQTRESKS